jgi:hypothetical protein
MVIFAIALRGSFRVSRGRSGSRFRVNVFTFFPVRLHVFFPIESKFAAIGGFVYKKQLSPVLRPVADDLTSANTERNMLSSVAEEHVPSQN